MKSLVLFWREALRNPQAIGAVGPSSKGVARALTAPLLGREGPLAVLEVGSGTGAVTREILERLRPGDRLDLAEINPRFARLLRERFEAVANGGPAVHVLEGDVLSLARGPYDVVVSSVPFSNMAPEDVHGLVSGLLACLAPGGVLSALHYVGHGLRSRLAPRHERLRLERIRSILRDFYARHGLGKDLVLLNLPPADIHYLGARRDERRERDRSRA